MPASSTLEHGGRLGAQEPRVLHRPPFTSSFGQECIDLAEAAGVHLDPWQQFCIHVALAVDARGLWAALRVAILVARQNGKGEILLALTLYWLFITQEALIVHTAHEFKTSSESFTRLKRVIDANDWMSRRIARERTAHGEEGYELTPAAGGGRIRILARSLNSGRGFTAPKVILDESQQLPTKAIDAMFPTLSAIPNPQVVFTGTVPAPEMEFVTWQRIMQQGRAGKAGRLAWMEFNVGERVPFGLENWSEEKREEWFREAAYAANPALGIRLNDEWVAEERETLSYMGYLRERLSIWSSDPVSMVIPMDVWVALAQPDAQMVGRRCIAVDCPPGLATATIGAMGRTEQGAWVGSVAHRYPGTDWVPVRVAEMMRQNENVARVVVDPASPAGALIAGIEAEGVEVTKVTMQQHAAACGMLYTRATETDPETNRLLRQFVHLESEDASSRILTNALRVATKRPGPDGAWLWNRKDSGDDISALVAVTLAGYGLSTLPEEVSDPWLVFT